MRNMLKAIFIGVSALFICGANQDTNNISSNKREIQKTNVVGQKFTERVKKHKSKKTLFSSVSYKKSKVRGLKLSEHTIAISFLKKIIYSFEVEPIVNPKVYFGFLYCVSHKRGPPYYQI